MANWGIILAAGLGVRMGSPKAFLPILGKPMLLYSLQAFQQSDRIDGIGVVARKEDLETVRNLAAANGITKLGFAVAGGKERQDSVREGLQALPSGVEIVAIHDAARPLLTVQLIGSLIDKAAEHGAAIAAIPMKDTVKVASEGRVLGTLKRSLLWCAQTPQVFRLDLFKQALEKSYAENFYGTDCASMVEAAGFEVHFVEGPQQNLKVTTPSDVLMAEALLGE